MKVLFFSAKVYDIKNFNKVNINYNVDITFNEANINVDNAKLTKGYDAICVFVNDRITKEVIDILKQNNIKIILLRCAGFNNVNVEYAKQNNIAVARVPKYSPYAVAEHAVALLLTLNRKIHKAYNRIREGNFSLNGLEGFDLYNKTVGIIGLGNIGDIFKNIMLGFGTNVLIYDPFTSNTANSDKVKNVTLDELYQNSDIISLHCPLNESTHKIINEDSLNKMKQGAILINTSRGKLVDTRALINNLKSGKLGGVCLDVYEEEENLFFQDFSNDVIYDDNFERLTTFHNVLITAHQAFFTQEALNSIANTTLDNAIKLFNNQTCLNLVD
ncbi:2-hydroxyacid dehydrogenase [Rickettsiales bacterium LUAb2]